MPYIQNALSFTIETVVGLYLIAVILRFLFQICRVDFSNPISQMIVSITKPPLKILRRFMPGLYGYDLAPVLLVFAVGLAKISLLLMVSGIAVNVAGAAILALGEICNIVIWTFISCILISAILSWVAPRTNHPAIGIVSGLCEPVLRPFRRILPLMSGIDLSPILALLTLNIALRIIVHPLNDIGHQLFF